MESAILTRLYKSIKIFSNENVKLKNNLSLVLRTNNRMVNKFHEMEVGKDTKIIELKMKLVEADLIIKRYRKETDFDGTNAPTIKERCENQANQIYELIRQRNVLRISLASKRSKINRLRREITSLDSVAAEKDKLLRNQSKIISTGHSQQKEIIRLNDALKLAKNYEKAFYDRYNDVVNSNSVMKNLKEKVNVFYNKILSLEKGHAYQSSLISSLKKEVKHQKSMKNNIKNNIKKQLEFERRNGFIEPNKAELLIIANSKIEAIKQLVAD